MNEMPDLTIRSIDPPERYAQLAKRMGVPFDRMWLIPGITNAGTDSQGNVAVGLPLLTKLSATGLDGTMAHELGHPAVPSSIYGQMVTVLQLRAWSQLLSLTRRWSPFAVLLFWNEIMQVLHELQRPARWMREYGADVIASEHIGRDAMILTLLELGRIGGSFNNADDEHPPFRSRILWLLAFAGPSPKASGS